MNSNIACLYGKVCNLKVKDNEPREGRTKTKWVRFDLACRTGDFKRANQKDNNFDFFSIDTNIKESSKLLDYLHDGKYLSVACKPYQNIGGKDNKTRYTQFKANPYDITLVYDGGSNAPRNNEQQNRGQSKAEEKEKADW